MMYWCIIIIDYHYHCCRNLTLHNREIFFCTFFFKLSLSQILGAYPETLLSFSETYIEEVLEPMYVLEDVLDTFPLVRPDQTEQLRRIEDVSQTLSFTSLTIITNSIQWLG